MEKPKKIREIKELCFICKKCGHNLFVDEKNNWVEKVLSAEGCPNC